MIDEKRVGAKLKRTREFPVAIVRLPVLCAQQARKLGKVLQVLPSSSITYLDGTASAASWKSDRDMACSHPQ